MAKGPDAFRTISEAADALNAPQHVLRFWETRFSFIRPMKRAGGRRFYRPHDVDVLRAVKTLLHENDYSIKGVQKLHKELGVRGLLDAASSDEKLTLRAFSGAIATAATPTGDITRLRAMLAELEAVKQRLDALLAG